MAIWTVAKQNGSIKLTYTAGGTVKDCGSGEAVLEPDLVAWVVDSASPGDIIVIEECGTFVRVSAPFASA